MTYATSVAKRRLMECSGDNIIMQIKHSGGTNFYDPYWNVFISRRFSWNLTSKPQEIFKMLIKFIKFIVSSTVDIGLQESERMRMDNTNERFKCKNRYFHCYQFDIFGINAAEKQRT